MRRQAGRSIPSSAALALHDALLSLGTPGALSLKWPNDVLRDGRKLAGILLEADEVPAGRPLLRIGIGVNLCFVPEAHALEIGALPAIGAPEHSPQDLLAHLAPAMAQWCTVLERQGFAPVRDAWQTHAAQIGTQVAARIGDQRIDGRFAGIDTDGALLLDTAAGRRHLHAADVQFEQGVEHASGH